jgi:23S rRNA (adenine2503-C2)-methyltransferase
MKEKPNIRDLNSDQLQEKLVEQGLPKYRAKQVYEWLWKKNVHSFDKMKNLPKDLISSLDENYFIPSLTTHRTQISSDGTIKSGFQLHDGKVVEGVLIPQSKRMTACISCQVGCSLTCKFCATGQMKQMRNLKADEIYDQVREIDNQARANYDKHLSNVVYMGMGEPLLNYKEMLRSTQMLISNDGMGMSPKRITVSTAGIGKMIKKLGDDEVKFKLAVSLHAADDKKRNEIMPINEQNNLLVLSESLKYYQEKTGGRITFEYIVFNDFNDEIKDAQELADFAKSVHCKINIIEYNPIEGGEYTNASEDKITKFAAHLESKNLVVNIRRSRGKDIDGACGQLANKVK